MRAAKSKCFPSSKKLGDTTKLTALFKLQPRAADSLDSPSCDSMVTTRAVAFSKPPQPTLDAAAIRIRAMASSQGGIDGKRDHILSAWAAEVSSFPSCEELDENDNATATMPPAFCGAHELHKSNARHAAVCDKNLDGHVPTDSLHCPSTQSTPDIVRLLRQRKFSQTLLARRRLAEIHLKTASAVLAQQLIRSGLSPPDPAPVSMQCNGKTTYLLDRNKQAVYSEFIRRTKMNLPEFVRLLRGESPADSRPNKNLEIPSYHPAWVSYEYNSHWRAIVDHGVIPHWKKAFGKQDKPPPNHGSARRALNTIVKNLRAGQDADRYLLLDLDLLSTLEGVTCSPFGAVSKGDVE